jgi:hypothetical protein
MCCVEAWVFADADGAAAAGPASAMLSPAVATPMAKNAGTGLPIPIVSLHMRQIAMRHNESNQQPRTLI